MLTKPTYLRIVRASAFYDLVVTAPFATPWTFAFLSDLMGQIHKSLGLTGLVPTLDPIQVLFANLMGSVVIVWSVARLHLGLHIFGRYDAAARVLFAMWMIYALASGLSFIILPVLVIEIAFAIAQLLPYSGDNSETA